MNRSLTLFSIMLAVAFTNVCAKTLNIGLVDTNDIYKSLYSQNSLKKIEKEFEPRKNDLLGMEKEIKTKTEALRRDREVLSEQELNKKEEEIIKMQRKFAETNQELQNDFAAVNERETKIVEKAMNEVLEELSKAEKLDLIIPRGVIMYNNQKADYTHKVVEMLDKHYKDNA